MSNDVSLRVKAQRLGGKLSAMVLPNLGAFMGWGILTALGIWLSNDMLKAFISPVLTYLLPLLIAISGGKMIYGYFHAAGSHDNRTAVRMAVEKAGCGCGAADSCRL